MTHTTITVYPKGIEVEVVVEGDLTTGGSNRHGSDEPEWIEVSGMVMTRTDGRALPRRAAALIMKEYQDYAEAQLVEA